MREFASVGVRIGYSRLELSLWEAPSANPKAGVRLDKVPVCDGLTNKIEME